MATKSGEKLKFFPSEQNMLYYPVGQKFARNHSISYHFSKIFSMLIFRKNPRWPPMSYSFQDIHTCFIFCYNLRWPLKVAKIEIFPFCIAHYCTTLWVKNSLEIALSLTVFEIFTLFHFPQKFKMTAKSGEN